ncbi:MAG: helix-turn-helix transcriptional regulator [Anaerolineales bacterium]
MSRKSWTFITNHGAVLALIGVHPHRTAREIAQELDITERTVLRIIKDLEEAGYLQRERVGRENRYEVNLNKPMRRRDQRSTAVGDVLKALQFGGDS